MAQDIDRTFRLANVYPFRVGTQSFLFDGDSLLLAAVPDLYVEAVSPRRDRTRGELLQDLAARHGSETACRVLDGLDQLGERGFFTSTDEQAIQAARTRMRDEILRTPHVATLQMLVSSRCNLKCEYCYAAQGSFGSDRRAYIALSTVDAAFDSIASRIGDGLNVPLLGGEPLLHPEITSVIERIRAAGNRLEFRPFINVTTNGTHLSTDVADCLIRNEVRTSFSIDGIGPVHDRQRPFVGGRGSYRAIERNLHRLIERGGRHLAGVRITCTRHTVRDLARIEQQIREQFGDLRIEVAPAVVPEGHCCALTDCFGDFAIARDEILMRKAARASRVPRSTLEAQPLSRVERRLRLLAMCEFGMNMITVTPDGDLFPCVGAVGHPSLRLGTVAEPQPLETSTVRQVWESNDVTRRAKCSACWARFVCGAGCATANMALNSGNPEPPEAACRMYREAAEGALRAVAVKWLTLEGGGNESGIQ